MEKFSQKWTIVSFLEPVQIGTEFSYKNWPLHCTLADVFGINNDIYSLFIDLKNKIINRNTINLEVSGKSQFGSSEYPIQVLLLEKQPEIIELHNIIFKQLQANGAIFNNPEYVNEGFVPHISYKNDISTKPGNAIDLKSISLIDMFPNGNGFMRKVINNIYFL